MIPQTYRIHRRGGQTGSNENRKFPDREPLSVNVMQKNIVGELLPIGIGNFQCRKVKCSVILLMTSDTQITGWRFDA